MCSSFSKESILPSKGINKEGLIIASSLLLFGLITRIPFASRMIYESDSARFALAMEHFDVAQMRPHAPGYILYVGLAKLLDLFIHDASAALVGVSIVSSALTAVVLYFLAKELYGRSNASVCALLLLTSPLFWFNGEMPFTYALEGLLSVVFAFACFRAITGKTRFVFISAIVLGLATGVRQNSVVMLFPLWLYALSKCSFRQVLISVVLFGITCLAWFIPLVELSGGWQRYFSALNAQFTTWVLHPAPFLFQIKGRWGVFSTFMVYSLSLGLLPMIYYFGRFFRIPMIIDDLRLRFLLLWFLPAVFFFIGVNVFNPGHVVVILPPLFICLAESIKGLARDLAEGIGLALLKVTAMPARYIQAIFSFKTILVSLVILISSINIYIFLFRDTQVSYAAIERGDAHLAEMVRLTKENFTPEKTIILTCWLNTQAGYYLPDYRVYCPFPLIFRSSEVPIEAQNVYISYRHETNPKTYWIPTGFKIKPIKVPDGIDTVILWENEIAQYLQKPSKTLRDIGSKINNAKVFYFRVRPEDRIYYGYHYLSVG